MIYQFIITFIIYFINLFSAYYVTEVKRLPSFLQFPPFHCRKCLTFWSGITIFTVIGVSFNLYILLITGVIFQILTAISMHIDQKNKTIVI